VQGPIAYDDLLAKIQKTGKEVCVHLEPHSFCHAGLCLRVRAHVLNFVCLFARAGPLGRDALACNRMSLRCPVSDVTTRVIV
jgi:hypothetical protein